jgi:DNA-binding NarL/FixJ family response regulator
MIQLTDTAAEKISVLIANSDPMGSQLIASALKRCRNQFEVVGLASTALDAISQLHAHNPDVALVSPELQDGPLTGFKVLHELRESHPQTAAIMLLHSPERAPVLDAFRGGARGVISRDKSFKALSKCIRSVHHGRIWVSNGELEYILEALANNKPVDYSKSAGMALLTPREEEVVNLVVQGMKNREIARELRVTEHTISNYLYRIFEKVGVSGRVELVLQTVSHRSQS